MAGHLFDVSQQRVSNGNERSRQCINVIALDEILAKFERIKLLKLDCEGSEFPILLTSRLLARVEKIIGEYHEVDTATMQSLDPKAKLPGLTAYPAHLLADKLQTCGFEVKLTSNAPHIGSFRACNTQLRDK
jgi:hypothetical protein